MLPDPWANAVADGGAKGGKGKDAGAKGNAKGREAASWGYFEGVRTAMASMSVNDDGGEGAFKAEIQAAIPDRQWRRAEPSLLASEWKHTITTPLTLDHK